VSQVNLTPEENADLYKLAGLPTPDLNSRTCASGVGRCKAVDHVHPSPFTQMDRREWMLSEGYTKKQIDEEIERLTRANA